MHQRQRTILCKTPGGRACGPIALPPVPLQARRGASIPVSTRPLRPPSPVEPARNLQRHAAAFALVAAAAWAAFRHARGKHRLNFSISCTIVRSWGGRQRRMGAVSGRMLRRQRRARHDIARGKRPFQSFIAAMRGLLTPRAPLQKSARLPEPHTLPCPPAQQARSPGGAGRRPPGATAPSASTMAAAPRQGSTGARPASLE